MMTSDQELLRAYVTGTHGAFRELVERHAGMIFGAAWRVTGDRTMAEEVVQDVFCLLARKSAALSGHPSVAGWLHRTAINAARSQRRARVHHEQKLARFASESRESGQEEAAPAGDAEIDSAIDRLPSEEREAVVLRFYQDQDYAQISSQLGVSEMAVRKRVSRGLQRLQRILGPSAAAGFSPACLAGPAPAGVMQSVIAAAPAIPPAFGFLTTLFLMNTKPALGIAAATLLTGSLTWWGTSLSSENQRLGTELATLRASLSDPAQPSANKGSGKTTALDASSPAPGVADLQAALEAEREKRLAAERDAKSVRDQIAQLQGEVVVSYGKVTQIGSTLGSVFTEALALVEWEKNGKLATPEGETRFGKFLEQAGSISGLSKEIINFEDVPEEGSRFIASAYGAAFGLDEAGQEKIASFFSKRLEEAGAKKFTLANLPARGSAEFHPWLEQRWAFFEESRGQLRELIPEAKQSDFDQMIEKGGYGFKNLTVKGMPLMFSLGGDPR
ncbi:MAG: sigma-70 family RNA polymerase sigma factor [Verrucomicrobiota bacterium]